MKFYKLVLSALVILAAGSIQAQDGKPREEKKVSAKSQDLVMIQMHYDDWAQKPDSINMKGLNRGFSAYIMMDFPFKKAPNFSFAGGIGIGTYNYYFDDQRVIMNEGNDNIIFRQLTGIEAEKYGKIKYNTAYAEAPLELRYFGNKYNRNKGFKASLGMKVGYLLSVHTKERISTDNTKITQKFGGTKAYNPTWTFAPTLRLGWGNFSVFGQYNLTPQFTAGRGPEVFPYAIGITISGM